jgi:hypothetical protein
LASRPKSHPKNPGHQTCFKDFGKYRHQAPGHRPGRFDIHRHSRLAPQHRVSNRGNSLNGQEGKDSYDAREILKAYKDQYGIEQNFGFLKDPVIVNSIFLKRPERIEVLGFVLLLSLLIWRLFERVMRQYVQREKRDLPGWKRRRTTRPTTFMIMTNFQRIMIIKIGDNRQLNKPFTEKQMEYLVSLKVDPNAFIKPGDR